MPGLLDAARQYLRDAAPGGLLNPEVGAGQVALGKGLLGFVPGMGDAISAYDTAQSVREGDWGGADFHLSYLLT